jgi:5-(carboxyamino)imidazole ribonucleotide synthase
VRADYLDELGLARLSGHSDAITTEFENVPAAALARLAEHRSVSPAASAVAIAQDRAEEKAHFQRCGVPCAPYAVIRGDDDLSRVADDLFPGILKTARLGYDGKGQVRVASRGELRAAWESLKRADCVLEKMLPLAFECSVVVARGADGVMVHLPVQRNLHREGILAVTEVHEQCVPAVPGLRAIEAAKAIAEGMQYVGVLCIEFFGLEDGSLVVNEMAPRPHNSGHWSIEGADVSQFELQVRTLAGLPLVQPRQHSPALMLNLLGDLWLRDGTGTPQAPDWASVLGLPGTHLHLYGKTEARPGRKMGHLTVTGPTPLSVRETALDAAQRLGIAPF